ncbi:hypothetical protein CcaverHIS002_0605430 [Cutaneotrichosporon cavernicola]|uniref:Uncharacterized protein n=1 Tax=Cutaneotrichosporon cavernicola TaxID=279322 RepID=A0AA48L8S0_9TREE|nr:uncharacterized protein CcaverHIS019_0604880 [Cutaneotrichosporon cavernicola]BEI86256.1 hypothetical protein CcaverHIS002_0605430 [Cutaneotrichosporon cavernicola]BEI94029.1 hypothetical protein CcaverHIS019_0604880 [Cutaneotrichosporon cavernicola]BEJ01809.1 hypothetical protein CcaverHIS631_0604910 [Cutaneotrichosporon cavernicola]BEJ09574.1 hypothetical protein CcaverHIS641_0604890 [Cutaneotrichosporon cavernicola]
MTLNSLDDKKTFWVLAAVILGFTLKGLLWLGVGGAVVAGWRRWRRGPSGPVLVEGSGASERQPLLDGESGERGGAEGAGEGERNAAQSDAANQV